MQDPTLLAASIASIDHYGSGYGGCHPCDDCYRFFQRRIVDINAEFESEAGLPIQELYDLNF